MRERAASETGPRAAPAKEAAPMPMADTSGTLPMRGLRRRSMLSEHGGKRSQRARARVRPDLRAVKRGAGAAGKVVESPLLGTVKVDGQTT